MGCGLTLGHNANKQEVAPKWLTRVKTSVMSGVQSVLGIETDPQQSFSLPLCHVRFLLLSLLFV